MLYFNSLLDLIFLALNYKVTINYMECLETTPSWELFVELLPLALACLIYKFGDKNFDIIIQCLFSLYLLSYFYLDREHHYFFQYYL